MKRIITPVLLFGSLVWGGCSGGDAGGNTEDKTYPAEVPASEKIPVVAWHGVRASHASAERFRQAEEMGITLNYSRLGTVETALRVMDYAAETGVGLIVECDELYNSTKRAAAVNSLKDHPALAGYFCMDEPVVSQFEGIAAMMNEIGAIDPEHFCYSNLFPTGSQAHYDALGAADYEDYVDKYLAACPVPFLSFDHYPIVEDGGVRYVKGEWYENLEIIRDRAKKAGMDFWSFLLTVPHVTYPVPTKSDLRLQVYSNLAYGTQALQCFTYWVPTVDNASFWNYRLAPIAEDGTKTETYDVVQSVLAEVQRFAWVFLGNDVTAVYHMGTAVPDKTTALTAADLPDEITELTLGSDESTVCVSFFTNHGYNFMMLVNTSVNQPGYVNVLTQSHVRRISKDGTITLASDDRRTMGFHAGDMLLYMW